MKITVTGKGEQALDLIERYNAIFNEMKSFVGKKTQTYEVVDTVRRIASDAVFDSIRKK